MIHHSLPTIKRTVSVFLRFLQRDFHVHLRKIQGPFINYVICYPLTYAFAFAYLQTNALFGPGNERLAMMLFSGNILVVLMLLTYKYSIDLLFDLEHDRYIDYQITILSPRLVIIERILFTTLFTFIMSLPFFPVAKLVLQGYLDTSTTSWLSVITILFFASACCAAYHQAVTCLLQSSSQIRMIWSRINHVLISFGGFWIPLYIMQAYAPRASIILYANPLLYISEGLRTATMGGPQFLPLSVCIPMLTLFTLLFVCVAWYAFKKRVDPL